MKLVSYQIMFYDVPDKSSIEGYVRYHFKMNIEGTDEWHDLSVLQLFARGQFRRLEDNTPVWGWDGNKEQPTLTPSFRYDVSWAGKLHLYVRNGKLDILPDTTIDCKETKKL